jgi:multidrug efflux pump subunit AcrA (membrane-fusion protein)
MDGRARTQPHDALLGCMVQASQPQIIPPGASVEGVPNAGNPTNYSLIIAPMTVDKQVVGLVEILMDPTRRAATQKSTLRFVSDLCDLAGTYLKNRQMRQMMSQQRLWNQLEGLHASDPRLARPEGGRVRRRQRRQAADRLRPPERGDEDRRPGERPGGQRPGGRRAARQPDPRADEGLQGRDPLGRGHRLHRQHRGFAPDIRDALEFYVDESGSKSVIVTLLYKPETEPNKDRVPFGCLVAEQIGDELASTDMHARTEVVSRHASTALWNAQEHDKIFLIGLWKMIGSPWRFFRGRTLAKIAAVLGAILTLLLIMTFVPWQLTIEGRGSLLPEERRITYAPLPGIVVEVPFDHGQHVRKGDVLARLESRELEKQLKELTATYAKARSQISYLQPQTELARARPNEFSQLSAQLSEARITADGAQKQIELIKEQLDSLTVTSPQDGIVTTWEVKKNLLGRPVEIGQELISVAATEGEWVLEVEVPDDDMAPIHAALARLRADIKRGDKPPDSTLSAYFVTATDPEHRYPGVVRRIASKAETVEGKHVVKLTVGFSDQVRNDYLKRNRELRPGSEVRARVNCGHARLAYVMLRDVVHVFYETILFRWPFLT